MLKSYGVKVLMVAGLEREASILPHVKEESFEILTMYLLLLNYYTYKYNDNHLFILSLTSLISVLICILHKTDMFYKDRRLDAAY